jgi:predicted GNAT superfamily acetyltransferase
VARALAVQGLLEGRLTSLGYVTEGILPSPAASRSRFAVRRTSTRGERGTATHVSCNESASPNQSMNYRWFSVRYDDFVYLDRVAVAADHRGCGIGSRLYEEVERRTRAVWFTLEVNLRPRNDGSLRFHARKGFVEVGQQETDYGALVSLMAKRLR